MLKLELLGRSSERAEIRMPIERHYLQEEGVVQGGILSALADATAVYLLFAELTDELSLTSIEFKISFLRPALPARGDLFARAEPIKRGRTIAVCRSVVSQDGRPVAEALLTYLFSAAREAAEA